jgi:hypothetical protein
MGASFMENYKDSQHGQQVPEIATGTHGKKPYQKPARRRERVFETSALACGKVQSTQSQCAHNRKNS